MSSTQFQQYTQISFSGRELLKKHNLNEYGVWQVLGEDPNCDMGGSHHQPDLGTYEGKLLDVVQVAVELPLFWAWGSGGSIVKRNIQKVDNTTAKVREEKRAKLKALEAETEQLRKDLSLI